MATTISFVFFSFFSAFSSAVSLLHSSNVIPKTIQQNEAIHNPFSPKAASIRYWNNHVLSGLPKSHFLLSKASPLTASQSAFLTKLAAQNSLSSHLHSFCSLANLFCSFDSDSSSSQFHSNFAIYTSNRRFSNYATAGGVDSFKNYSTGINSASDSFLKYSPRSNRHNEVFANYAVDANVATATFGNYGSGATGGVGDFKSYQDRVNVPGQRFTTYDSSSKTHKRSFTSYSQDTNAGSQSFISYGKKANRSPDQFTSYAEGSNTVDSGFTGYGELSQGANDSFTRYGNTGNNPHNNFKSYGTGGASAAETFSNYRDGANVGEDTFQSYVQNSNSGRVSFTNYGKTFNPGNDTFKEYGKGSKGLTTVGFKSYSSNRTFKDYAKNGVTFSSYNNNTTGGVSVNKRKVEAGRFFRESMLKEGNVMVMPDIVDRMPERSFLPRTIVSKLPFSSSRVAEVKDIFHAAESSTAAVVIENAVAECERAPSVGETKRCVGSMEDMIDFAVTVLGSDAVVRTTENVEGSKREVMIGAVKGIDGGRVTKAVSCHQSLYPYLLYYCHSVPKVRVYEAEIVEVESRVKINHGVAICHIDTSAWSSDHGAFVALGYGPGQIEICHWIFENDMTWTSSD
ncbi:Polygalacturonase 1 beta-like protein 3 [Linum grandiflorum]